MARKSSKNNYLKQAGILAAAGIICRIIGILYRSPLTSIIGDEGNGYYTSAYNIYTIILLLSSYSIPSAVSKIIASKLALKEYRNAHRIFRCALIYVCVIGGAASLFTLFGAELFLEGEAAVVLRVFSPTIFLSGFVGVLRGYFQAHGSMIQTSFSQILEQILNAVISILAANLLIDLVTSKSTTAQAIYGAAGSALGTGSGVVAALLFMLFVYAINRKMIYTRIAKDRHRYVDSYGDILRGMLSTVTPIIMSTFIYNFSTSFNQTVYSKVMIYARGLSLAQTATSYGIFAGKAMVIINIPIALASSLSAAMIPTISASSALGDQTATRRKVVNAMWTTMLIAIPSSVGLAVLAKPIMQLLFPQKDSLDMAAKLLAMIAITVVFYSLSTLSNGILQGIGQVKLPVRNAAIALAVQTVLLVVLLMFTELDLYALVICLIVYSFMMCVLNSISVRHCIGVGENFKTMFLMPAIAAAIMGAAAKGTYMGMQLFVSSNIICLVPSLLVAVIIYFVAALMIGAVGREQLLNLPKGQLIVRVAEKCHLLRR
ncbi:polysaccharide biosynthesis protein [Roseburia sp. BX1005]|uniref:Polysaccharide biosynthesis protein n=1 Tax=Roseburia zhanii TaxID=2763064 RepID=A0A923RUA3_9FIRM|nr:polysaccharide biosynthesis protein [Roseburia zhanii]MBC5715537.1 polysaccharide biosynthesis protein [Roseburia zhanii]